MVNFLKSIPIPICGLILALVSMGNLIKLQGFITFGNVIGIIGIILESLILLKIIFQWEHTVDTLKNPIVASVSPTFTMGLMTICTYFVGFFSNSNYIKVIWLIIIVIHFILMIYFSYFFLISKKISITDIYPSWFIVYVGMGDISVTSNNFYPELGRNMFWITFALYIILLPVILKRVFIVKNMEEPTLPLITIIAAPGSLCLTGYMNAFNDKNLFFIIALLALSQILYFIVIGHLPRLLKLKFYPSYAAFTFPLVISATAVTTVNTYFNFLGMNNFLISLLAIMESIVAFIIVLYVLFRYLSFLMREYKGLCCKVF
ncbi:hypothetical protein IIU_05867 [Bacillus cereus VD133]|uniref:Exfoliative toxin A/B n=1 Tax=Bacillus cereus VD133 TaxID=1053233 RepID=A0A9W5PLA1_BACCE|nr:TDT family transporter [Bacillus cereus]EOO27884.1 hypothetical protein IIU_05867 [Bacillus cereus VD133]